MARLLLLLSIAERQQEADMLRQKGLTTWVLKAGNVAVAVRWNMKLREAAHTLTILRGRHTVLACGPFIVEW